ncbi:DNA topoisomerase I [Candidatus Gottesmanbacteria bacterium RIFCSPHIGHO2_01_FULL_39_10]|uniref:DNA topoisomerase 1 n=1 Tax=Candidatus Gottesmanbacteria bacterium RIFCSPHIGHO2_01_FULL_39_10 TaxID=1798375 RepID=A0A1F5ZP67_9BACT|nr:MAG: DNA topoisomerase I [Candidatus Gottesmanbacteria bacterium RIFCSPHIGHO2_01_FULL_39_10]
MQNLVIVESPTKARTLSRFLGSDYRIEATMGHIRDLPAKRLGVDIEHDFKPLYQVIPGRSKRIKELKSAASSASSVILATDPDREGEAIAYHINHLLGDKRDTKRIVFHEITPSAIKQALDSPRSIDLKLVDAQTARRILDRLVGYKLSPILWNKLGKNWLSAGRVQTVALRLIVEREREIRAFKSEEYWVIEAELERVKSFIAKLVAIDDKKAEIKDKITADEIAEDLKRAKYFVKNIETKEVRRYPSPPYTTSTLQQAGANKFGWSAKRTMQTAQKLYEEGFITYHRTDSTNLSSDAISMVRKYIGDTYGEKYLPASAKFYKTKSKVAQEAHEAIRPTDVGQFLNSKIQVTNQLGRESFKLYELIWKRFVACQMNEANFQQTSVSVEAKGKSLYLLRASGQRTLFDGFLKVYGISSQDTINNNQRENNENKELPPLNMNDPLNLLRLLPQQKFTEPPPRYNEASLIKILEEKGIGRPSTYAPIISTIQDRKYVEKIDLPAGRQGRKFHPTDLGFEVNDFLIKYFPDIFDVSFTAKMEDNLDSIASGDSKWVPVIHEYYDPLAERIKAVYETAEKVTMDLGTTDEKCPVCGSPMVVRMSRYGKFLACSTFPQCKGTKNILEKTGIVCPLDKGEIIVKRTRRGKQFYGCINWPNCKFAAWKKEDIKIPQ